MCDYRVLRRLGDGAQGRVYAVEHVASHVTYAMKVMPCRDSAAASAALCEVRALQQLSHPHIVGYVDLLVLLRPTTTAMAASAAALKDDNETYSDGAASLALLWHQLQALKDGGNDDNDDSMHNCAVAVCVVMELCTGGDMQCVMRDAARQLMLVGGSHPLGEARVTAWLLQCAEALAYMHARGCVHRDVKPSNILVDAHGNAKMADLGLTTVRTAAAARVSCDAAEDVHAVVMMGTPNYLAPECLLRRAYSDKADVWALGAVALELMTLHEQPVNRLLLRQRQRQHDKDDGDDVDDADDTRLSVASLVLPRIARRGFTRALARIVLDALQRQPAARPTAAALLQRLAAHYQQTLQHAATLSLLSTSTSTSLSMLSLSWRNGGGGGAAAVTSNDGGGASCVAHDGVAVLLPLLRCGVCEVDEACVVCSSCATHLCVACDAARHRHASRAMHVRTPLTSHATTTAAAKAASATWSCQIAMPALGTATRTHEHTALDATRNSNSSDCYSDGLSRAESASTTQQQQQQQTMTTSLSSSTTTMTQSKTPWRDGTCHSIAEHALQTQAPHAQLPPEEQPPQLTLTRLHVNECGGGRNDSSRSSSSHSHGDAGVVHVPDEYATLAAALEAAVTCAPHIRRIVVAGNTVHRIVCCRGKAAPAASSSSSSSSSLPLLLSSPLLLSAALPVGLHIVGDDPAPVLETADGDSVLHCLSGSGSICNFVIRHTGVHRGTRAAVVVSGGEWQLLRCRIASVHGSGVVVGARYALPRTMSKNSISSSINNCSSDAEDEDVAGDVVAAVVRQCAFVDVSDVGVVVDRGAGGVYADNTFVRCGYAALLLRGADATTVVRGNSLTHGTHTGVICHDARGTVEGNVIAHHGGCGVVVKGARATPLLRGNRIVGNAHVGVFCCDRAAPLLVDNDICECGKAGVIVKAAAAPSVLRNTIADSHEAGVYVFDGGSGVFDGNDIHGNGNAGVLVTTRGCPCVVRNRVHRNAYEGVWVCRGGGGTYCGNDLRDNDRGAADVEGDTYVTYADNVEEHES